MVVDFLKIGEENKISFEDLKRLTGCNNERELRRQIATERKSGHVILSSSDGGYWLPSCSAEVERYIRYMTKEAKSILYMLNSARAYLKKEEGQIEVSDVLSESI